MDEFDEQAKAKLGGGAEPGTGEGFPGDLLRWTFQAC